MSMAPIQTLHPAVGGRDLVCGEDGGQGSGRNCLVFFWERRMTYGVREDCPSAANKL